MRPIRVLARRYTRFAVQATCTGKQCLGRRCERRPADKRAFHPVAVFPGFLYCRGCSFPETNRLDSIREQCTRAHTHTRARATGKTYFPPRGDVSPCSTNAALLRENQKAAKPINENDAVA